MQLYPTHAPQQAAVEKGKNSEAMEDGNMEKGALPAEDLGCASESFESLASQMNELAVSSNSSVDLADSSNMESQLQDTDKRIRALKKKVYFNPAFFSLLQ